MREHTPGDPPTRFLQAIEGLDGQALVHAVSKMINKREAVEFREKELERFPNLLTIEDYVSRYGGDWSFDRATIEMASATADYFDRLVGFRRFI